MLVLYQGGIDSENQTTWMMRASDHDSEKWQKVLKTAGLWGLGRLGLGHQNYLRYKHDRKKYWSSCNHMGEMQFIVCSHEKGYANAWIYGVSRTIEVRNGIYNMAKRKTKARSILWKPVLGNSDGGKKGGTGNHRGRQIRILIPSEPHVGTRRMNAIA